ncbi:YiiX/YebB-like N1pC/P60 family cysteine hydrolase [uncultured Acetobacteroides sp.]|uniref:YiiX/YebB-like N1pC/P60 family cysteine hydrolase n=1 Tax=uncultured Acetobacteroides sp. TaxID=1760811 RepID=UPI0029F4E59A|nr:YiiX/YebB-like N1pC/P60 family cysteine hydrolase [uncultured Acetobacteroides sp.]
MKHPFCKTALATLTLLLFQLAAMAQGDATPDSASYANLIHAPVARIFSARNGTRWIIAGKDSSLLYRVTHKGVVINMRDTAGLPCDTRFSDVLIIRNNRVLVGTKNRYVFSFNGDKAKWINSSYGLTDSTIDHFEWDKRQKLLFVETANSRFLVKHHNKLINIRFSEVKDTLTTFDEIRHFIKSNFRWSIQKGICEVCADIDFSFRAEKFVSEEDLQHIKDTLRPGDIIVKRNDEQLSNVGIPGFWTHSGIYVGSLAQLDSCFSGIAMLGGQKPSAYIQESYREVYERLADKQGLIIEAIGKGVVINPVEHIAKVDYLAALRTNLDKADIFKSLLTAFEYLGTPYDYLFDFSNDNELVCSELVYLSFRPSPNKTGINFIMGELDGETFLSPNDIAKQYSLEWKQPSPQLKLVFFYDAKRRQRKSERRNEAAFAKSWRRKSLY